jgi:glycosyltransferase involved in cell wall biosynthesis
MTSAIAADPAALRVLFITHAFPRWPGDAAGSFILGLARALVQRGIGVTVLAPHARELPIRDTIDGVPVLRFRYALPRLETLAYTGTMAEQVQSSWSARASLATMLGAGFWRVLREPRRVRAQLLHAHWWFPSGLMAAATARLTTYPVVTTIHGSDVRLARSTPGAGSALGWVMRGSRVTTAVSRWLSEEAHALSPGLPAPLVAPMPAATDLFFPGDARNSDRLLYVGRLNAQKGIGLLLEALPRMRCQATLDVIGDGPDAISLRELAMSLGITDRIVWHGPLKQHELAKHYRRATALVVPSREEGLGLVAVEAQLCETPVIAFDSGGLRDIVISGKTGRLVRDFTPEALAVAADELLGNSTYAIELGKAGRRAALAVFAPDAAAERYEEIYRLVLEGPARHDACARASQAT